MTPDKSTEVTTLVSDLQKLHRFVDVNGDGLLDLVAQPDGKSLSYMLAAEEFSTDAPAATPTPTAPIGNEPATEEPKVSSNALVRCGQWWFFVPVMFSIVIFS